jgi:hypothetical protein
MFVGQAPGQMVMELFHIQPHVGIWIQANVFPINVQPIAGKGFFEGGEGPTQGGSTVRLVVIGPEQVDQRVAPVAYARHRNVGQQGRSFTRIHLNRDTVELNPGRA